MIRLHTLSPHAAVASLEYDALAILCNKEEQKYKLMKIECSCQDIEGLARDVQSVSATTELEQG